WTASLGSDLDERRKATQAAFLAGVESWWNERFLPQIARWQSDGDWRRARAALLAGSSAALVDAGADPRGVPDDVKEQARAPLQARLDARRGELDRDWNALDGELRTWVDERIEDLRARAEERSVSDVSEALQSAWTRELALRHLDPAQFPSG